MDDKKPMPEATANEEPRDFIRDMVQADLARGLVQGIVTRFPPEPNGYLHLGHAKSICLNFGLSVEYGGRCHLRFDDTNPVKEEQEYIDAIKRDIHWLGFDWASICTMRRTISRRCMTGPSTSFAPALPMSTTRPPTRCGRCAAR